ncbi:hypothetical protein PVL29_009508 [Vitis rotundifolia]|uniref:Uncharacterized protein n=1 Tax=Vitis rotundifolia TaxID=103349 RepID=A0AA38ZSK4_VITRO|nr:hypothetical protein PVL29_009508 [Vitis rotundifolia]
MGEGLGETTGVGENDDASSGVGAGDGDFLNDLVGRSNLSTVKRQGGVTSSTVLATLDDDGQYQVVIASVSIGPSLTKLILKLGGEGLDNIILCGNALRTTFRMTS